MNRYNSFSARTMLLIACLGVGGYSSSAIGAPAAASAIPAPNEIKAPEQKNLVVQGASPVPNIGYLPLYVGQKMGFFDQEGLNVEINYSHGDSVTIQAINTGQAQVMSGTPEALIHSYEKGLNGVLFYQIYRSLIYSVAVPGGGKISSPANLAGKTIGVSSMGSTGLIIAKIVAKDAGIDPASLKFLPVGTGQRAISALKEGQVDALSLWDAAYAQIETAAPDMKLTYWRPPSLSKVGDGGYFTTWDTIQKMPNALAHFTRAIQKSLEAIHDNPTQALDVYWQVNPSAKPKGSEAEAHKIGLKELEVLGRSFDMSGVPSEIDVPSLDAYIKTFLDQGLITKAPPIEEFVTNRFLPIAQAAARERAK
ncbi:MULTISPECIES: ABC transporter substrate-binding protein [Rhodopseudomonas]|nr:MULTISPECIES: ABC transporter substrate-binding protein [Rhodopseudomonas]MDF3811018.1 ABC transporter substrate-binding protein [Rhodopseudomonas sp. BAL398]WOK15916.1 ABC transporter substrate-binding protein [Rhodopseudomonas sp. BAL398]